MAGSRSARGGRDPQKRTLAKGELRGSIRRCERSCMPGTYTQAPTSAKGAKGAAFPLDPGWQKNRVGWGVVQNDGCASGDGLSRYIIPFAATKVPADPKRVNAAKEIWPCARCPPSRGEFFCNIFLKACQHKGVRC